jgi:protein involved in polysaccharide export with SLBB domain
MLEDGDVVTIQGRGDYQAAPYIVNIEGAVNRPGPVILSGPKVRLSEVIKEAGGLKPEAFPMGVEFARNPAKLTNTAQKQTALMLTKLNDILNQDEYKRALARSDIERIKAVGAAARSGSGLSIPGITPNIDAAIPNPALASGTQSLFSRDLVSPPRKLTPEDLQPNGNVAVDLRAALAHPGGEDDILMADGDTVTVPTTPTTVEVIGAVMQSRGVLYHEGARLDYYLDHVGGYSPDASRDRVLVIHLGGGLVPIKKVKEFLPGDVIIVPTKVLEAQIGRRQNDLDTIFRNLTSSVLVVLVAKKLLGL